MGSASLNFIAFGVLIAVLFNLRKHVLWRQSVFLLANLAFLLFFSHSPLAFLPFVGFLAFGFGSLRLIQKGLSGSTFVALLVSAIAAFVWLKKYSFVPSFSYLTFPYFTLGLSYIFFRVLHLLIDARQGALTEQVSLLSYLNYTLNFTTLVSGPIQRYQDFSAMEVAQEPLTVDAIVIAKSVERIVVGFFKVNVLSLLFSAVQTDAIAKASSAMPWEQRVLQGALIVAVYPIYLYCNFSGYIDIVIGLARLLRLELPENFNRPFSAGNFIDFWTRWHITLSNWLKTYVYNPLLISLMERFPQTSLEPLFGVLAFFVTFCLVGIWHGQTSEYLFYGFLLGASVSCVKLYQLSMDALLGRRRYRAISKNPIYMTLARGLNFAWCAFTLLWFWSKWGQIGNLLHWLGPAAAVAVMSAIFLGSAIVLEAWEQLRTVLFSWSWNDNEVLTSRYVRTVWGTALAVVAVAVVLLLNAPAPQVVYKGF